MLFKEVERIESPLSILSILSTITVTYHQVYDDHSVAVLEYDWGHKRHYDSWIDLKCHSGSSSGFLWYLSTLELQSDPTRH